MRCGELDEKRKEVVGFGGNKLQGLGEISCKFTRWGSFKFAYKYNSSASHGIDK